MTNQIEPYSMIQKTNIKEHNDMIDKINEIVDVINVTNLDTINAEISGLKTKATETDREIATIKDKDTMQDTEINGITKNLVSNVTATFDNPSRELKISLGREASPSIDATVVIPASSETGQYSAGNGITIQDHQIAVDTNVVALKTDIPDVPPIDDLTQRVNTLETEMPTKVNIAQGVENAGKVLGIGEDGNVTPVDGGAGGEVWEEVDLSNIAIDWSKIDRVKVCSKFSFTYQTPGSWTTKPSSPTISNYPGGAGAIIEMSVNNTPSLIPVYVTASANFMHLETIQLKSLSDLNSGNLFEIYAMTFNGGGVATNNFYVTNSNAQTYLNRLWVKLKS